MLCVCRIEWILFGWRLQSWPLASCLMSSSQSFSAPPPCPLISSSVPSSFFLHSLLSVLSSYQTIVEARHWERGLRRRDGPDLLCFSWGLGTLKTWSPGLGVHSKSTATLETSMVYLVSFLCLMVYTLFYAFLESVLFPLSSLIRIFTRNVSFHQSLVESGMRHSTWRTCHIFH